MSLPAFEEAVERYGRFLDRFGVPKRLRWVFRDDVCLARGRTWLVQRVPVAKDDQARALYEKARQSGLGIEFRAIGVMDDELLAYLWVPSDRIDAEQTGLSSEDPKFTVPVSLEQIRPLPWYLRLSVKRHIGIQDVPAPQ